MTTSFWPVVLALVCRFPIPWKGMGERGTERTGVVGDEDEKSGQRGMLRQRQGISFAVCTTNRKDRALARRATRDMAKCLITGIE